MTLRTACLLGPQGAFVVTLQRFGSLLALATSYTAAWSLPWPDSHRQVEYSFRGRTPGIDNAEIIDAVHARRPPVIPATAGLRTSP